MKTVELSSELGERIMAARENNRLLLKNAGLPEETASIEGRQFLFYYAFNGRKEVTIEGKIESVTITKQKNGVSSGMYVNLVPSPCIFCDLPVLYFQFFTSENALRQDPTQPLRCDILLNCLGKSLNNEFSGDLILLPQRSIFVKLAAMLRRLWS